MPRILLRFDDDKKWRIYWSGSLELADPREFDTIEDAGPATREILEQEIERQEQETTDGIDGIHLMPGEIYTSPDIPEGSMAIGYPNATPPRGVVIRNIGKPDAAH